MSETVLKKDMLKVKPVLKFTTFAFWKKSLCVCVCDLSDK